MDTPDTLRLILPLLAALLAGGCAATGTKPIDEAGPVAACDDSALPRDVVMHLDLIADMHERGLHHAALAHLDALEPRASDIPRALYLRAEALRRSGRGAEAAGLYRTLSQGCLAALGHHGLARVALDENRREEGLRHLQAAVRVAPTDTRIRNDLGYALLLSNRPLEALAQFQTAVELGGGRQPFSNRLLALLLLEREAEVQAVVREAGLSPAILVGLREQAEVLRGEGP